MEQTDEPNTCGARCGEFFANHWKGLVTFLTPLILLPVMFSGPKIDDKASWCLFVVLVMAVLWITEAVPLYITAMIPIVIFPVMGIMDSDFTCRQYFKDPVVLFAGGLIVALSLEYCNLHQRLALKAIIVVGCGPRRILLAVVIISMFLSMWISNSATTAMMCPIIHGILEEFESQKVIKMHMDESEETGSEEGTKHPSKIAMAYYLGIAYASTIGGCATPIGTATNMAFKGIYETRFPNSTDELDFADFMIYSTPWIIVDAALLYIGLAITHMGLCRPQSPEGKEIAEAEKSNEATEKLLMKKYQDLGGMSIQEFQILVIFILMVVLLFFRKPGFLHGWATFFHEKEICDSLPVVVGVLLLFLFPVNFAFLKYCCGSGPFTNKETPSLISWKFIHVNMPWGLIFLIGGGFALSTAIKDSGLAHMLATHLAKLKSLPPSVVQTISVILGALLTAFSSNVAICNMIIPVLAETAVATRTHPLYLIFPAGLACSVAFMLPVSTPPNAIVAGYSNMKTKYMMIAGILPSITMMLLIIINGQTLHHFIYPDAHVFPEWAEDKEL